MPCLGCVVASLVLLALATLTPARGEFVAIRVASRNRTLLCWAIKLSPVAYVADAECVRSYRKHQIVMIYGDAPPGPGVRERLGKKVDSLRQPPCRHRVPSLALVGGTVDDRSALGPTVRNFIASYGTLQAGRGTMMTCRECQVLAIRRVLPCPGAPAGTVVLYSDCLRQLDAARPSRKSPSPLDAWTWKLRRDLKRTLYQDLERRYRQRLEMLNFIASARR
uniref:Uncharacterized protein n=1 Tax=Anopheles farauti TaxID=69004 RepID=A0A182Q3L2_9DIPT